MKKSVKKNQGFAMAELLAVCVVVLGLFSVMVSNYLPLLAKYEQRLSYNDVTAEYAAHYIRKVYYENGPFEVTKKTSEFWNRKLREEKYVELYDGTNKNLLCKFNGNGDDILYKNKDVACKELENIVVQYGVEEIIMTKYNIEELKKDDSTFRGNKLYNYIEYLPSFKIKGKVFADSGKELFRLIIKTKDYGYATTALLSENIPDSKCITVREDNNKSAKIEDGQVYPGYVLTGYKFDDPGNCPTEDIDLSGVFTKGGRDIVITSIDENVFNMDKHESVSSKPLHFTFVKSVNDGNFEIGKNAFKGTKLASVTLNDDDSYESSEAINLTKLPSNTSVIGGGAFSNISTLKYVSLDSTDSSFKLENSAFSNNVALEKVKLNVSSLSLDNGDSAFLGSGTSSDTGVSIEFGNDSKIVSDNLFRLSKINSISFNDDITEIGSFAFGYVNSDGHSVDLGQSSIDINLPSSLTKIYSDAFNNMKINSLVIPDGVETIGGKAFLNSKISGKLSVPAKIKTIEKEAFKWNKFDSIEFLDDNSTNSMIIGSGAFTDCENRLTKISFPNHKTVRIGESAFSDNENLSGVLLIPASVEDIGNQAFENTGISSFYIKDSDNDNVNVRMKIGSYVVNNCRNLNCIRLGNSVSQIEHSAFRNILTDSTFVVKTKSSVNWCGTQGNNPIYYFTHIIDNKQAQVNSCSFDGNNLTIGYKLEDGSSTSKIDKAIITSEEVCPSE